MVSIIMMMLACPLNLFSESIAPTDSTEVIKPVKPVRRATSPIVETAQEDDTIFFELDSAALAQPVTPIPEKKHIFDPDATRAAWMSALFPGLGQLYNRRYWKLPIVVGGFMALGYATSWNNSMLKDYNRGYADMMDNDPNTKSYMDFFPPNVQEQDLDKTWLTNLLKSRKNFYRRNRDLCIISMVGVYLLAMVDAYVDAQLTHFDISPDLSLDFQPTLLPPARAGAWPSVGFLWAVTF